MPVLDRTIPFRTVTHWVRSAAQCGFALEPLLKEVGIDPATLQPDTSRVDAHALIRLMDRCVEQARQSGKGLHFSVVLGESFNFDYLPDVETFITTSPTLRDAQPVLDWLPPLINPFLDLKLQEHGPDARLILTLIDPSDEARAPTHLIESGLVTLCKFTRLMLGDDWQAREITLQHGANDSQAAFEASCRVPVRYGQPLNALWFDRHLLDRPLRGALPGLHEVAAKRVLATLQRQSLDPVSPDLSGTVGQLTQLLLQRPELLGAGIETQAQRMRLHPRTLQRRLQQQGQTHSAVLAAVRLDLARQWLLRPDMPLEDIAHRLGFADRRNFTEAFIRWTGMPPSQWREQQRRQT